MYLNCIKSPLNSYFQSPISIPVSKLYFYWMKWYFRINLWSKWEKKQRANNALQQYSTHILRTFFYNNEIIRGMTDNSRFSKADIIRIICSRHRYPINRLINLYWYYQQVLLWLRHNAYFLNPNTYIMYYTRIFNILNTPLLQVNYINK